MEIKKIKITAKNQKSFESDFLPVTIIHGENGKGKSSIVNSLIYALSSRLVFDDPAKKGTLADIATAMNFPSVQVTFENELPQIFEKFSVCRGVKEDKGKNKEVGFILMDNGNKIEKGMEGVILTKLGQFEESLFLRSILCLSAQKRKDWVLKLLNLEKPEYLKIFQEITGEKINGNLMESIIEAKEVLRRKRLDVTAEIKALQSIISDNEKSINLLPSNFEELKKNLADKREELSKIAGKTLAILKIENARKEILDGIKSAEERQNLIKFVVDVNSQKNHMATANIIHELRGKLEKARNDLGSINEKLFKKELAWNNLGVIIRQLNSGVCPTCGSVTTEAMQKKAEEYKNGENTVVMLKAMQSNLLNTKKEIEVELNKNIELLNHIESQFAREREFNAIAREIAEKKKTLLSLQESEDINETLKLQEIYRGEVKKLETELEKYNESNIKIQESLKNREKLDNLKVSKEKFEGKETELKNFQNSLVSEISKNFCNTVNLFMLQDGSFNIKVEEKEIIMGIIKPDGNFIDFDALSNSETILLTASLSMAVQGIRQNIFKICVIDNFEAVDGKRQIEVYQKLQKLINEKLINNAVISGCNITPAIDGDNFKLIQL